MSAAHPGPLMFYVLAPFYWLTGQSSIDINLGALVINGGSIVGMALIARRRGGVPPMLFVLIASGDSHPWCGVRAQPLEHPCPSISLRVAGFLDVVDGLRRQMGASRGGVRDVFRGPSAHRLCCLGCPARAVASWLVLDLLGRERSRLTPSPWRKWPRRLRPLRWPALLSGPARDPR